MSDLKNKELDSIVDDIEANLAPQLKASYEKLVVAGQKAALNNGVGGILYALGRREDVVLTAVRGSINLVGVLKNITKGTPPPADAMAMASFTLLMYALDFAEQSRLVTLDQQTIGKATRLWMNNIMHAFGMQPRQVQAMSTAVDGVTRDPAKMDMVERYIGYTKDPRISSKTLPDDEPVAVEQEEAKDGV